jgi:hypothetical protein
MKKREKVSLRKLIQETKSEDQRIRQEAVQSLGERIINSKGKEEEKIILQTLLRVVQTPDEDEFTRRTIIQILSQMQDDSEIDAALVNVAVQTAKSWGGLLWSEARALLKLRMQKFMGEEELKRLTEYDDVDISASAADTLEQRAKQWEAGKLITAARDSRFWVRKAAIQALETKTGPEVNAVLIEALKDESISTRRHAINALASKQEPEVTRALIEELKIERPGAWTTCERGGAEVTNKTMIIEIIVGRTGEEIDQALLAVVNVTGSTRIRECAIKARAKRGKRN